MTDEAFDRTAHLIGFVATLIGTVLIFRFRNAVPTARRKPILIQPPASYPPLSADTLVVETERFLDTDQETPDGPYEYFYSGMYYTFIHGDRRGGGRWYDDEPEEMSLNIAPLIPQRVGATYAEPPYGDPLLAEMILYLQQHEPARIRLTMLCDSGYVPIDIARALSRP